MSDASYVNRLIEDLRRGYVAELPALFDEIEAYVMQLRGDEGFADNYAALFRKVHNLKGTGGTFGLHTLSGICHRFEDHLRLVDADAGKRTPRRVENWLAHIDLLRTVHAGMAAGKESFPQVDVALEAIKDDHFETAQRVFIVEPSRATRMLCQGLLGEWVSDVVTATTGLEALTQLMHDPVQLIITGLEVPVLNGKALLAAIRLSGGPNRQVPAILLTSKAEVDVPAVLQPVRVIRKDGALSESLEHAVRALLAEPPTLR